MQWWEDGEKLKAMSPAQLSDLWRKANSLDTDQSRSLKAALERLGLGIAVKPARGSVRSDDPLGKKLELTIFSPEGRRRALEAQNAGLPPLAGVDPLLQDKLGKDYQTENEATIQAGDLVAKLMEKKLGYRKSRRSAPLPANCIARSGLLFDLSPKRKAP